jgi:peroxiredoxin
VSISNDQTREDAGLFAKQVKATFPVVHDAKNQIHTQYGVDAHPTNIVVNKQGKIARVIEGADVPAIQAAIAAALR